MILKCIDGPMDGAVYVLSKNTSDPAERSTNRKPDGLWFDGQDEHGRNVQHQYKFDKNSEHGTHLALAYKYDGQVVETGIEMETEPRVTADDICATCGSGFRLPSGKCDHCDTMFHESA